MPFGQRKVERGFQKRSIKSLNYEERESSEEYDSNDSHSSENHQSPSKKKKHQLKTNSSSKHKPATSDTDPSYHEADEEKTKTSKVKPRRSTRFLKRVKNNNGNPNLSDESETVVNITSKRTGKKNREVKTNTKYKPKTSDADNIYSSSDEEEIVQSISKHKLVPEIRSDNEDLDSEVDENEKSSNKSSKESSKMSDSSDSSGDELKLKKRLAELKLKLKLINEAKTSNKHKPSVSHSDASDLDDAELVQKPRRESKPLASSESSSDDQSEPLSGRVKNGENENFNKEKLSMGKKTIVIEKDNAKEQKKKVISNIGKRKLASNNHKPSVSHSDDSDLDAVNLVQKPQRESKRLVSSESSDDQNKTSKECDNVVNEIRRPLSRRVKNSENQGIDKEKLPKQKKNIAIEEYNTIEQKKKAISNKSKRKLSTTDSEKSEISDNIGRKHKSLAKKNKKFNVSSQDSASKKREAELTKINLGTMKKSTAELFESSESSENEESSENNKTKFTKKDKQTKPSKSTEDGDAESDCAVLKQKNKGGIRKKMSNVNKKILSPISDDLQKNADDDESDYDELNQKNRKAEHKENKQGKSKLSSNSKKENAKTNDFVSKKGCSVKHVEYASNSSESESSESCSSTSNYESHKNLKAKVKNAACKKCGTTFRTHLQLISHMRTEHSSKLRKCVICLEAFQSYNNFVLHMSSYHPEVERYPCKHRECQSSFHTLKKLRDHEKAHYIFTCPFCKKRYTVKRKMLEHVEKVHF